METRTDIPLGCEAEIMSGPSHDSLSRTEKFVSFKLGQGSYAVLAAAVAEVTHPLPLTPLPGRTPCMLGISPLRGEILGILDLRRIVGEGSAAAADPKSKQIVLKRAGLDAVPMAFIVDRIGEVAAIGLKQIRPAQGACEFLIGETEIDGRVIKILDHSKLVTPTESDRPDPSF